MTEVLQMKKIFLIVNLLITVSAFGSNTIRLEPGVYQCSACLAIVNPISEDLISVSPSRGCSDFGKVYNFEKDISAGENAYSNYRTTALGSYTAYMYVNSATNYTFQGIADTICSKVD